MPVLCPDPETALVNLAVNARDAMESEGTVTIRLCCDARMPSIRGHGPGTGDFVAVSLSDTGIGIAPDDLERIFEPFFTTKDVGKGTGLGLSQVFGFAKQSGGDVDVESVVGKGSTFTLYLPQAESTVPGEPRPTGQQEAIDGEGRCVLVVEDNISVGQFATQLLEDLGYGTAWVTSAEEALDRLGSDGDGFDIVFSDVVMPGMGGIELAKRLARDLPAMPVVLASGYSHVLAQEGAEGLELLRKPYSASQLSAALQRRIAWANERNG
ncbi:Response regulator receiver domain-containing protein [Sphingomonas sp. OV641]|uniref:ATP-binding protein n=1 Tax=Sphingomonas TaxID=13687 RepID=UPI0008C0240E|nr:MULTISPECIES: ATP-binding protein [Sphingomonas]SEK00967.1 Response regulator receiver domain-containing protein [Sphingomonas sp. OV641]